MRWIAFLCCASFLACGGDEESKVSVDFVVEALVDEDEGLQSVELGIDRVALSEDGFEWEDIYNYDSTRTYIDQSRHELSSASIPAKRYDVIRVALKPGEFVLNKVSGPPEDYVHPTQLKYRVGAVRSHATEDNGFIETNSFFEFSTANGTFAATTPAEGSSIVLTLEFDYTPSPTGLSETCLTAKVVETRL